MQINVNQLKKNLEPYLHPYLKKDNYEIKNIDAIDLLTANRFDIAFKLLYLELKKCNNTELAKQIYATSIKYFTLNHKLTEPDNPKKNNIFLYIKDFNEIFANIKTYGFDKTKTVIPLAKDNSILNGSHRIASSIYLNKKVSCVKIDTDNLVANYQLFKNRGVPEQALDIAATTFVEYAKNIYIAFIFPLTNLNDRDIKELIPNVVYQKNLKLNFNGMTNLISQIYSHETWMNREAAIKSAVDRFATKGLLKIVVFQENCLKDVIKIKTKIRSLFNLGNNSIHITDTIEEAKRMANIVFNNNSVHFLNYGKPNIYNIFDKKLKIYQNFICKNNINTKDIVLDAGIVLAAYGLRNSNDIDYLISNSIKLHYIHNKDDCNSHDEELIYHNKNKEDLIYNQKYFFYFNDIKFIALHQISFMKKNRNEKKDINDIKLINNVLGNNFFIQKIAIIKYSFFYMRTKIMVSYIVPFLFNLLKDSKAYYFFRMLYRKYLKEKI